MNVIKRRRGEKIEERKRRKKEVDLTESGGRGTRLVWDRTAVRRGTGRTVG